MTGMTRLTIKRVPMKPSPEQKQCHADYLVTVHVARTVQKQVE
jgi:hypothetical protein